MRSLDREVASVLFADLASSTLVRSELGQSRADELETALLSSMHEIVANNGGSIVRSTGDGLVSTFPAATACLDAAVSLQQAVDRVVRAGHIDELNLRVGVSVGDITHGEFGPLGIPMAQAARLEQAAPPGSILCIDELRYLLGASTNHVLDSLGALELKGLPHPLHVAEVRWSALPSPRSIRTEITGFEPDLPLVGRDTELLRLGGLVGDAVSQRSVFTALVHGDSGMGKTRLLYELAHSPGSSDVSVLYTACRALRPRPFGPIRDILQVVVDQADPELLRHWAARDPALGVELPGLASRLRDLGEPLRATGEETRYRSIAALSRFLCEIVRDQPLVVAIDDVQWIDNSSIEVIESILRREDIPLVVVCAAGVGPERLDSRLVEALQRRPGHHVSVTLEPLVKHDVADLVSQVQPSAGSEIVDRLWAQSLGSPFVVGDLVHRSGWDDGESRGASIEPSFVQALATLDPATRRFVEAAAVLGSDVDPWLAGEAAELADDDMIVSAEQAEQAGLLRVTTAQGTLSLTFRHNLIAEEIRRLMETEERFVLHRRAAAMLLERSVDLDASVRVRIATHLERAGHLVEPKDVARAYLDAADAAFHIGEFQEVIHLVTDGLVHAPENAPLLRARLLLRKARSHGLLQDPSGALTAGIEVAEIAQRLGDNRLLAEAATIQIRHARGNALEAQWNEVCVLAIESFDDSVEPSLRSLVLSNSLWVFRRGNELEAATSEAVTLAERDGTAEALVTTLYQRLIASIGSPQLDEQTGLLARLRSLWEPFDWGCSYGGLLLAESAIALARGDRMAFDQVIAEARRHVERAPVPWDRSWYQRLETVRALVEGRWADADRQLGEPLRSTPSEIEPTLAQLSWSMIERGTAQVAEKNLSEFASSGGGPYFRAGLALALLECGRADQAHEVMREIMPFTVENHRVGLHTAAGVLAPLTMIVDVVQDVEVASELLPVLEPWEGQMFWVVDVLILGAADRFLAILASCLGDEARARRLFVSALGLEEDFGAPPLVARTSLAYARNLHRWGDLGAARLHRDRAAELAEEFGMARLLVECAELL